MKYRDERGQWDDAGDRGGRYPPDGRASAGARDSPEPDGYYSRATYSPDRTPRSSWHDDGGTGGRHRRDSRALMGNGERGAFASGPVGPRNTGRLSPSGWFASTASLDAGPDRRPSGHYPVRSQASRTDGPRTQDPVGPELRATPRLAGVAWLATGAGMAIDGLAVALAWHGSSIGIPLFWFAIIAPFLVFATILVRCWPSRATRQLTVALLGLYPAVIYRMSSPLVLGGFDEHLHERTLNDLLSGSGLFAPNPLLTVGPRYPGLELFTGVLIRLTGLPVIAGMSIAVFICRVLLVLAIYHGALAVTRSYRRASLMVIFYAASPQFYFFNSMFAYQTLALALAIGGLVLLHRALQDDFPGARRPLVILATISLLAAAVTHHATSWITLAFLVGWTVTSPRGKRRTLALVSAVVAIGVINWTALAVGQLWPYMGPIFTSVANQFLSAFGKIHLFKDSAGSTDSLWERAVIVIYALIASCAAVTSGWIVLMRSLRNKHRTLAFIGILSAAYPITLAAHFETTTASYGDRLSTFMALPVALCCSLVIRNPIDVLRLHKVRARPYFIGLVSLAALAFVGGVVFGSGPSWSYLPGKYLVDADIRSQDPETLAAVRWAASHLPPGSRVVADRVSADLLASEARAWPVDHPEDGLDPATIYFSKTWQPNLDRIIKGLDIQYIYIDERLSTSLPHEAYYIFPYETAKPTRLSLAAVTKFSSAPGLSVAYHHGPITIYDTVGLGVRMTTRDGYIATRPLGFSTPLQVVAGAILGLLLVLPQRRWARLVRPLRYAGVVGYGTAVIALAILVGAVLFETRWMPGAEFTIGAVEMAGAVVVARRWSAGQYVLPRQLFGAVHPIMVFGLLGIIAGALLSIHGAWSVDITAVDNILRSVTRGGSK